MRKRKIIIFSIIILIILISVLIIFRNKIFGISEDKLISQYIEKLDNSTSLSYNKEINLSIVNKKDNTSVSNISIGEEYKKLKDIKFTDFHIEIEKENLQKINELIFNLYQNKSSQYYNINNNWYILRNKNEQVKLSELKDIFNYKKIEFSKDIVKRSNIECYKLTSKINMQQSLSEILDLNLLSINNKTIDINYYFNIDTLDLYEIEILSSKELEEISSDENEFIIKNLNISINNINIDKFDSLEIPEDAKQGEEIENKQILIDILNNKYKKDTEEEKEDKISYIKWKNNYNTVLINNKSIEIDKSTVQEILIDSKWKLNDNSKSGKDILSAHKQEYIYGTINNNIQVSILAENIQNYQLPISKCIIKEVSLTPLTDNIILGKFNNIDLKYSKSSINKLKKLLGTISYIETESNYNIYFWTTKDYSNEIAIHEDENGKLILFKLSSYKK